MVTALDWFFMEHSIKQSSYVWEPDAEADEMELVSVIENEKNKCKNLQTHLNTTYTSLKRFITIVTFMIESCPFIIIHY